MNPSITIERILELCEEDDNTGICTRCGTEQSNTEPDAENSHCEACGAYAVFGAEQLLISLPEP